MASWPRPGVVAEWARAVQGVVTTARLGGRRRRDRGARGRIRLGVDRVHRHRVGPRAARGCGIRVAHRPRRLDDRARAAHAARGGRRAGRGPAHRGEPRTTPVRRRAARGAGRRQGHRARAAPPAARRRLRRAVPHPDRARGIMPVGPARTVRADPVGLMRREIVWSQTAELHVHPRTIAIAALSTGFIRDLEGSPTRDLTASDIAFHALREYVPGDDRRFIHWKSSAKTGTFMVRQFEETRRSRLMVLLDLEPGAYTDDAEFELAVSAAASVGARAIRDARTVSFVVSGPRSRPAAVPRDRHARAADRLPRPAARRALRGRARRRRPRSCPTSRAPRPRACRASRSRSSSPAPRGASPRCVPRRRGCPQASRRSRCSARPRARRPRAPWPASPCSASATSRTCARCSRDGVGRMSASGPGGRRSVRSDRDHRRARRRDARARDDPVVADLRERGVLRGRGRSRSSPGRRSAWPGAAPLAGLGRRRRGVRRLPRASACPARCRVARSSACIPTPQGLVELVAGAALSWKQLVTIAVPVGSYQALLVPPFLLGLVAATCAVTIALRSRRPAAAASRPRCCCSPASRSASCTPRSRSRPASRSSSRRRVARAGRDREPPGHHERPAGRGGARRRAACARGVRARRRRARRGDRGIRRPAGTAAQRRACRAPAAVRAARAREPARRVPRGVRRADVGRHPMLEVRGLPPGAGIRIADARHVRRRSSTRSAALTARPSPGGSPGCRTGSTSPTRTASGAGRGRRDRRTRDVWVPGIGQLERITFGGPRAELARRRRTSTTT